MMFPVPSYLYVPVGILKSYHQYLVPKKPVFYVGRAVNGSVFDTILNEASSRYSYLETNDLADVEHVPRIEHRTLCGLGLGLGRIRPIETSPPQGNKQRLATMKANN